MTRFRQQKVGDQLQVELADLIQHELRDPRVGFVTVTEVRMSRDLKHARIYVSILGDGADREESLAALARASGFLKAQIGKRLQLRFMPALNFVVDETLDHAERIDSLLDDTPAAEPDAADGEPDAAEEPADG